MEKKTIIKVPDPYLPLLEDIRLLQSDSCNPNVTTLKQQEQIWISLQKYGWAYPIVTNKDGKSLLNSVGEKLPQELMDREPSVTIPATYEIIAEYKDELNQKTIFEKLKSEGYKLRILTL